VSEQLRPEAVARTHQAAHQAIGALLERGRAGGAFRADLPEPWLVAACVALVHACADAVRAGVVAEQDAPAILVTSVRDLFTGPGR
jgi:TetR/AcrR family transcriptional regulator, mexCD-oprJ operon repressor